MSHDIAPEPHGSSVTAIVYWTFLWVVCLESMSGLIGAQHHSLDDHLSIPHNLKSAIHVRTTLAHLHRGIDLID